jgi:hypothetical protein
MYVFINLLIYLNKQTHDPFKEYMYTRNSYKFKNN